MLYLYFWYGNALCQFDGADLRGWGWKTAVYDTADYEKFKQLKEQLFLWQESCAGVEYQNIQWYYEKVGLYMLMMGGIWMWIFLHDSLSSRKRWEVRMACYLCVNKKVESKT